MSGVVGGKVRMTVLAAVLALLVLPLAGAPAAGAEKPSVKLSKSQAGTGVRSPSPAVDGGPRRC